MIQTALVFIKKKLDQFLVTRFELDESVTVLNYLISPDGSYPKKNQNKMVITLINLDYDTNKQFQDTQHRNRSDPYPKNPDNQKKFDSKKKYRCTIPLQADTSGLS